MLQITERIFYECEDFNDTPDYVVGYSMTTGQYINQLHKLMELSNRGIISYQVIEEVPNVTINVCY